MYSTSRLRKSGHLVGDGADPLAGEEDVRESTQFGSWDG